MSNAYALSSKAKNDQRQRIIDHNQQQEQERLAQLARDRSNAETRRKYLAGLDAEKAEKRKLHDIATDLELEPQKQTLRRQWLVDHPGKTSAQFESGAWPLLRENLITERTQRAYEATSEEIQNRMSGALSF